MGTTKRNDYGKHLANLLGALVVFIVFMAPGLTASAQSINAGNDTTICLGGTATLQATVVSGSFGTNSYSFEIIPYQPYPFSGGTPVRFVPNQDDKIAGPFDIGFEFCFFNALYSQFYIGSNGWVGFSYNSAWTTFTAQPIPNTNINVPKNCIMAPWQDWWPGYVGPGNQTDTSVFYYLTGTAPNRKLVVYWLDCKLYNCTADTSKHGTFQIVLNEQNSIVENNIHKKPNCSAAENATQGVHNIDGTVAFTAFGRNCTPWTVIDESTRFVPEGIRWFQNTYPGGPVVGYGDSITLNPTVTTTYIASVEHCDGGIALDTVVVTVIDAQFNYAPASWCVYDPDPVPTRLQNGGSFAASPAGLVFLDTITGQIDLSASTPGTYTVIRTITIPCTVAFTQSVTVNPSPAAPVPILANVIRCGPGNVSLEVVNVPGTTVRWFDAPVGGSVIGSGNPLVISVASTDTFYVEATITATGCNSLSRTMIIATVNPIPAATATPPVSTICSADSTLVTLTSLPPGSTFSWTATSGSPFLSGFAGGSGALIRQKIVNTGTTTDTVLYTVTPTLTGCPGSAVQARVAVRPVPAAILSPPGQVICSGALTGISLTSAAAGTAFTWTATGSGPSITGYAPGSGSLIQQLLSNSGTVPGTVTYTVSPTIFGCPGPVNSATVTVNPVPAVTFPACIDAATTTAGRPITLRGGIPYGGVYSGTGVAGGVFTPSAAGAGNHTVTYTYTNLWACPASATFTITVTAPAPFACGGTLTDVRDNKSYPTVLIGAQCWMAANLNFGNAITSAQMQRDNCLFEKYCYADNGASCASSGGLYQWDEVMQYAGSPGIQGFCPPSWHIPTQAEWNTLFSNYINNGFAANPLKYSGYSGFNALLTGVRFDNRQYNFDGFATLFWTSDSHGPFKAWAQGMNDYDPSVSYYPSMRNNAFSVRCLKD